MERERRIEEERDQRAREDFRGGTSGAHGEPQTESRHPPEWAGDLNPDQMAGQNIGEPARQAHRERRSARDHKELNRALSDRFSDDELGQITVLRPGDRLQQGATYMDLRDPERREFTATGEMEAGEAIVPKDEVPYQVWNRLRGVDDPERTGGTTG
jgi:hypothetical protein